MKLKYLVIFASLLGLLTLAAVACGGDEATQAPAAPANTETPATMEDEGSRLELV